MRAAAYDDERDRVRRVSELDAIRDMWERHVKAAMFLQGRGLKVLSQAKYISPRVALDMVSAGMQAERLARGESRDLSYPGTIEGGGDGESDGRRPARVPRGRGRCSTPRLGRPAHMTRAPVVQVAPAGIHSGRWTDLRMVRQGLG